MNLPDPDGFAELMAEILRDIRSAIESALICRAAGLDHFTLLDRDVTGGVPPTVVAMLSILTRASDSIMERIRTGPKLAIPEDATYVALIALFDQTARKPISITDFRIIDLAYIYSSTILAVVTGEEELDRTPNLSRDTVYNVIPFFIAYQHLTPAAQTAITNFFVDLKRMASNSLEMIKTGDTENLLISKSIIKIKQQADRERAKTITPKSNPDFFGPSNN